MFERVDRYLSREIFPLLYLGAYVEYGRFLCTFTIDHLFEVGGHGHVDVEVEPFEFITAPRYKASVFRLYNILGRKEFAIETALGFLYFKILKERHGAAFGYERLGSDTHPRCAENQNLSLSGLGIGHNEGAEQVHGGIGRRKLHFRDCQVHRRGIDFFRNLKREGNILHIALEKSGHAGFAIEIFLIITVDRQLFGQAFNLVVGFALEHVGIRDSAVSNKIVDSPVREKLLHHFSAWHLVVGSSPCLDNTFKNLILRIDSDIIKRDCQFPGEQQRFPYHMAVAFEMSRFIL